MHSTVARLLTGTARAVLLFLVGLYRRLLSPVIHSIAGPGYGCRFSPSCSEYARDAVRVHGPWKGTRLAAARILRCQPWNEGGWDPVPRQRTHQ